MAYWDSVKRFSGDIKKYADDEIYFPELALRLAGEGGNAVGEAAGTLMSPLGAVVPDFVKEWAGGEMEGIGNAIATGIQALPEDAQEVLFNERLGRNLGSLMDATNLAGLKMVASPNQWKSVANNMKNERPNFYKGGAALETLEAAKEGITGRLHELTSPRAQAMLREQNLPERTQNVVRQANADAVTLKNQRDAVGEQLKAEHGSNWKKFAGKGSEYNDLDAKYKQRAKVGMGQIGQNKLINEQYGDTSDMINRAAEDFTYSTKGFTPESFRSQYPELPEDAADALFRTIQQTQGEKKYAGLAGPKVPIKDGVLLERKAVGGAAGDLMASGRRQGYHGQGLLDRIKKTPKETSHNYTQIQQMFADRPIASSPQNFDELMSTMTGNKKLTNKKLVEYLGKSENQEMLNKALQTPFTTQAELVDAMKAAGMKGADKTGKSDAIMKDIAKRTFSNSPTKGFNNFDDMISAMEDRGMTVYNKAKRKGNEPAIVVDSVKSGAMDLGGMGRIHAVFPDGRKYTVMHDKNDLMGSTPYGAKSGITTAGWADDYTGGRKGLHKEPQREPLVLDPSQYEGTNFVNPATNRQKAAMQEIMDYEPTVGLMDYARAARNGLFLSSLLGL